MPLIPADGRPGRYRLIASSSELPNVKVALEGAARDLPPTPAPPTPRPTGQPAPAAVGTASASTQDAREVIKETCPTGQALVGSKATDLYAAAPPAEGNNIASYPPDALVRLLDEC